MAASVTGNSCYLQLEEKMKKSCKTACFLQSAFIFVFFCFCFLSCSFIEFSSDCVKLFPGAETSSFYADYVQIKFNCEVEKYEVQKSVTIKAGKNTCELEYYWQDSSLLKVKPENGWINGQFYECSVEGYVYKKNGNGFSVNEKVKFWYLPDSSAESFENFTIVNFPSDDSFIELKEKLIFSFSKAVEKQRFENSFSIHPAADYTIECDELSKTFYIIPQKGWSLNSLYEWKIDALISDDNWSLSGKTEGSFFTKADTVQPELLLVCPVAVDADSLSLSGSDASAIWYTNLEIDGNLKEKMPVGFIFSKPMDFESVKAGVSFSPAISGTFFKADSDETKFIFVPQDNYEIGAEYILTVSKNIKDKNGLNFFEEVKKTFFSGQEYLQIESIKFGQTLLNGTEADSSELEENSIKETLKDGTAIKILKSEEENENELTEVCLGLLFSQSIEEEMLAAVEKSISLNAVFPLSLASPVKTEISWANERKMLFITWSRICASTEEENFFYKLKIAGGKTGLRTGRGNYLEEDLCAVIKFY